MSKKTPDWMPELFFSHRYEFAVVADQLGFRIGTRADQYETNRVDKMLDEGIDVDFVDNNFEDPDRDRICDIVERVSPTYVVLPDIYSSSSVEGVVEFGELLSTEYGVTPIVVPKCEFDFTEVPDSWLMGFSVPSGYGGTDIQINQFDTHRVHLLGGSPRNQIKYANVALEADVKVYSVDGNAFAKASGFGNIINEPVEILDKNGTLDQKTWVKDADGYTDWGQRIAQSLARYYELWRQWSLRTSDEKSDVDVSMEI